MVFEKKWKTNWELQSLTFDQLYSIVIEVITKQMENVEKENLSLESNLIKTHDADSVDIVAILLYLEDLFKNASPTSRTVVPTDKLGQIRLVEDILDIIYEVLIDVENKMKVFVRIVPDFDSLDKRQNLSSFYP
jgi:acyl carrier protein